MTAPKINLTELLADREAGTGGEWVIDWFRCTADKADVDFAKKDGQALKIGDILWSVPRSIGPISIDHNHWAGDHLDITEPDARRIARLPALEAAYIEAVGKIERLEKQMKTMRGEIDKAYYDGRDYSNRRLRPGDGEMGG